MPAAATKDSSGSVVPHTSFEEGVVQQLAARGLGRGDRVAIMLPTGMLPIALRGTRRVLRDGSYIPISGRIDVWVGSPIVPSGTGWASALALRGQAMDAIAAHCGEPRLDMVPAGPVRSTAPSTLTL
jgi:hypothetical protein